MPADQIRRGDLGARDWIRDETGGVVEGRGLDAVRREIPADESFADVHIRSKLNCFRGRLARAQPV